MDKCFELVLNSNGQWDIIDHKESKEKGAVCIYNDLGVAPYSAASSLCDLLNELDEKWVGEFSLRETLQLELQRVEDENEQLKSKNRGLQSELQIFKEDVTHSNFMINKLGDENRQLKKENQELRQDNDIKFWKHQFMIQHNSTQLILHELSLAMNEGYEVSDKFKEWLDDLTEKNKEAITKHERLFE